MQFKPKYDRVLVRRESLQERASLIHIPEDADKKERPARGVIVALGPLVGYVDDESKKIVRDLAVGMKVIFGRHAGTEIEYGDEKVWIVTDRDILCEVVE